MKKHADLPFASTLCGSCTNVCPVKIDIHEQLYQWRQVLTQEGYATPAKTVSMQAMGAVLKSQTLFRGFGWVGRRLVRWLPAVVSNRLNPWYNQREMPRPPAQSFGEWYRENRPGV